MLNIRHAKIDELDLSTHQDKIEFESRDTRGERGETFEVGATKPRRSHEEIQLVRTRKSIEVAGDDHRLLSGEHQVVKMSQLLLTMSIFERQVHEKYADVIEFHFYDQSLDAGGKVMESLSRDSRGRQNRIPLFTHDRELIIEGCSAVLALINGVMTEVLSDVLGLIDERAANRARVDFDQANELRVFSTNELRDVVENASTAAQITRARQRQVERRSRPSGVSDVVDEQSQWKLRASEPYERQFTRSRRTRDYAHEPVIGVTVTKRQTGQATCRPYDRSLWMHSFQRP